MPPDDDAARTTSPGTIMPRSPWIASAGWMNRAGVPVEDRVAATFFITWPLLPMPVQTTRPRQSRIRRTASAKSSPSWPINP